MKRWYVVFIKNGYNTQHGFDTEKEARHFASICENVINIYESY